MSRKFDAAFLVSSYAGDRNRTHRFMRGSNWHWGRTPAYGLSTPLLERLPVVANAALFYLLPLHPFSPMSTEKTSFFGQTAATSDFLRKNGISYTHSDGIEFIFLEIGRDDVPRVYLLSMFQQLRVVSFARLASRYVELTGKPAPTTQACFVELVEIVLPEETGQVVYRGQFEDVSNRSALIPSAYDAAKGLGVTHATARWFGHYLVSDAFFGFREAQEFTDRGLFIGEDGFLAAHTTVQRQLKLLQQAGALTFESLPREAGFYLKFNRQCLPGIKKELLPRFFEALLF